MSTNKIPPNESGEASNLSETTIPKVSDEIQSSLNPMQLEMYRNWLKKLFQWLVAAGKNPEFGEGYAAESLDSHAYRINRFASWVYKNEGFTTDFSQEQANQYWNDVLKPNGNKLTTNRKAANSIALIFKFKAQKSEKAEMWTIPNSSDVYQKINKEKAKGFTDWFTVEELEAIRQAALSVYAVPRRDEMAAEEREEWAAHLSQRLRKPKNELDEEDWETANSYKIPSLVYASTDLGLRPKEVERSRWGWFNLDEGMMTIPKSESVKNTDEWRCYMGVEAVNLLRMWKDEAYGDGEEPGPEEPVWTTRQGNPYSAGSLRKPHMQNLMKEAGIDTSERESGWYMIRRGVGTDLGTQRGLNAVMNQLRITHIETAKRYVRHNERGVREWLESR